MKSQRSATPPGRRVVTWCVAAWLACACARDDALESARRAARELPPAPLAVFASPEVARAERVELGWDLPDGWRVRASSGSAAASFYVRSNARVRCRLTLLAGDGGGLAASVDRWRAELGLKPATAAELARASVGRFLDRDARIIDLEGRRKGLEGEPENAACVGLVACDPRGTAIFELVGPRQLVAAERGAFLDLARSLEVRAAHAP
ncbi:MAG: hypothetical protein K8S98_01655 [Planctomycetes bacterium]|nr:hypothetical protein [Planctomycetota bacterium]